MGTSASGVTPFRVPLAELLRRLEEGAGVEDDEGVAVDDGKAGRSVGSCLEG